MNDWGILNIEIYDNPVREILACVGIILMGLLLKRYGATLLSKQSFRFFKKFAGNRFSEEFVSLLRKPIEQTLTLLILYYAFDRLKFPEAWNLADADKIGLRWFIITVYKIALLVTGTKILLGGTKFFSFVHANRDEPHMSPELSHFLKELIQVVIVIASMFAGLRFIFNVNITALIASLGIGGLAVALAAQDTLANLLGSFIIYLDKPFNIGDHIEFGETRGTVEHVGFRTTRIRTDKSLLTVPNKKIVDAILNNITLSEMRRVRLVFSLNYNSKPAQVLGIVEDIRKVISQHKDTTDDITVNFSDFENNALNILVIYFVNGNDYDKMIAVKEEINIRIMQIVESHGCHFAMASQTVYLAGNPLI